MEVHLDFSELLKLFLDFRVEGNYGAARVFFIGREEFLRNKRAAGRAKDLADIEALGEK